MANVRFCWENRYTESGTVLAASSELSAMPVAMTKSTDRSNVWRSEADVTEQTIDIDLGAVRDVSACCLANAKPITGGAIELYQRGDAGAAGAAVLVGALAAQDTQTRAVATFFALQSHRYWQLKFTNPGVVNDFAELGFVFLGEYTEPEFNVKVPIPGNAVDPSVVSASVDGQESYAIRAMYQQGAYSWDAVRQAQLEQLQTMFNTIGIRTPLFMVLDTAISWTCVLARITGGLSWNFEPGGAIGRFDKGFSWREVR